MLAASSGGKPDFFIAGIVIVPVAMTLPGPLPESAPMKLLATTAAYPVPPVNLPRSDNIMFTAPSMIPVLVRMTDKAINAVIEYSN